MNYLDNRSELLTLVPEYSKVAELGVLYGGFSQEIMDVIKPLELVLIDSWDGHIVSGDVNGNNVLPYHGDELFICVTSRFKNTSNVKIFRNKSEKILNFENDYFDFIYIDADHSYDSVKSDLENSFLKLKNGAFLAGHDYDINSSKTNNTYDFGVKRAVDEFCEIYNQQIDYICMDGCTSFAIQIKK